MILVTEGRNVGYTSFGSGWEIARNSSEPMLKDKKRVVLWDSNLNGFYSDKLFWKGHRVVNGFRLGYHMETDPEVCVSLFENLEIPTPASEIATSVEDLRSTINDFESEMLVVDFDDKELTFNTKDEALSWIEDNYDWLSRRFEPVFKVREYIGDADIMCTAWVSERGVWNKALFFSVVARKELSGDLGVISNGKYALSWSPSKGYMINKYTRMIAEWFHQQRYVGSITVRFTISDNGIPYAISVEPKCRGIVLHSIFCLVDNHMGMENFLNNLYEGDFDVYPVEQNMYCFALKITKQYNEPIAVEDETGSSPPVYVSGDVKIGTLTDNVRVSLDEGGSGVATICGMADKWTTAVRDTYSMAKEEIRHPEKEYRDDGIEFLSDKLTKLSKTK